MPSDRRALRAGLAVVVLVVAGALLPVLAVRHQSFDLKVYRGALEQWTRAGDLYGFGLGSRHLGFTYPPFAALCLLPLLAFPTTVAVAVSATAFLLMLAGWTRLCVLRLPTLRTHGASYVTLLVVPPALLLQPMRDTLTFGQVNLAVALLVLLDLVLLDRGSRWAGVGAGLAAAVKLTPALFLVFYLVAGARAAARRGFLTAAAATLAAALVAPGASVTYWTSALLDRSRVGAYGSSSNQSLAGLLTRLTDGVHPPAVWLPLVLGVTAACLVAARRLYRDDRRLEAFTVVGLSACLASPITWVHHVVWLLPALLVLVERGLARRAAGPLVAAAGIAVAFMTGLPDLARALPGHHLDSWRAVLGENLYGFLLLGLVVALAVSSRATGSPEPVPEPV